MKGKEKFGDRGRGWMEKLEIPLVAFGGLILFVAVAYGVCDAVFAPAPSFRRPGFMEEVLGDRAVVAAIRIAVVFAAAFFVVSVVALTCRRQWLIRVGPVEVSDQVADLGLEKQRMEESLENALQTIDSLRYELVVANLLLDRALSGLEKNE